MKDWRQETGQLRWIPIEAIDVDEQAPEIPAEVPPVLLEENGNGRYRLLAGREHLQNCRRGGGTSVDALVMKPPNVDEQLSWLLSKLVKGELHYLAEAEQYGRLLDMGLTRAELSARLGRSQATLQRKLRLLGLDAPVRDALIQNGLCERYAQLLLRIPGNQGRLRTLEHIVAKGLDVKAAEELIDLTLQRMPIPIPKERKLMPVMRDHRLYLNAIRGVVEQMNDAGIDAVMHTVQGSLALEVRISVPVFKQTR